MTEDLNIILNQMDAINTDIFDFEKLDMLVAEGLSQLDEILTRDDRDDYFLSLGVHGRLLVSDIKDSLLAIQQMRT